MDFDAVLAQVHELLQRQGRVSYRALPLASAIARTVQWVASPGGGACVRATTRSTRSVASRGMREGLVRSRSNPSTPASM